MIRWTKAPIALLLSETNSILHGTHLKHVPCKLVPKEEVQQADFDCSL
uniref:Uncharacterized protein n=1 Tax=Arundo donax TaxID=35708 RepID=A0A0A9AE90_ARUDO